MTRFANGAKLLERLAQAYQQAPEFIREDLLEGLLVGGGIGLPVALMPNQDPHESAAALLGGISAATFGGALSRKLGAAAGRSIHKGELAPGSFGYNMGRSLGQEGVFDVVGDMMGVSPVPKITGAEVGRALGRSVGDEVFGVAGTIGALGAAQAMDSTPDEQPQPSMGSVVAGTVPGALFGLATSGLTGGLVDIPGLQRALDDPNGNVNWDTLRQHSVFRKKPGGAGGL